MNKYMIFSVRLFVPPQKYFLTNLTTIKNCQIFYVFLTGKKCKHVNSIRLTVITCKLRTKRQDINCKVAITKNSKLNT